jgi:hypothetical protein
MFSKSVIGNRLDQIRNLNMKNSMDILNIKIPKKYREVKESLDYGTANYLYDL